MLGKMQQRHPMILLSQSLSVISIESIYRWLLFQWLRNLGGPQVQGTILPAICCCKLPVVLWPIVLGQSGTRYRRVTLVVVHYLVCSITCVMPTQTNNSIRYLMDGRKF